MPARASHYIVRPGPTTVLPSGLVSQQPGRLVPLVAVDQLPPWLDIVGVPRQLPPADAVPMVAIGGYDQPGDPETFAVRVCGALAADGPPLPCARTEHWLFGEAAETTPQTTAATPASPASVASSAGDVSSASIASIASTTCSAAQLEDASIARAAHDKIMAKGRADRAQAKLQGHTPPPLPPLSSDSSSAETGGSAVEWGMWSGAAAPHDRAGDSRPSSDTSVHAGKTSGEEEAPRKMCEHWCHTGRCAYGTRCKFVHTMPLTREGLQQVKLDGLPAWWLEEVGLVGAAAHPENGSRGGGVQNAARKKPPKRHYSSSSRQPSGTGPAKTGKATGGTKKGQPPPSRAKAKTKTASKTSFAFQEAQNRLGADATNAGPAGAAGAAGMAHHVEDRPMTTGAAGQADAVSSSPPLAGTAVMVVDLVDL